METTISIGRCPIKCTGYSPVLSTLSDFETPLSKPFYTLHFKTSTKPYRKINTRTVEISDKLNIVGFQYVLRILLQDYFSNQNNGFFLHCSAVRIHDSVALFFGPSGAGKSTISDFLSPEFQKVADDAAIIRKWHGKWVMFQTPFAEKKRFSKSALPFPIRSLHILHKGPRPEIKKKSGEEALYFIIKQLWTQKSYASQQIMQVMDFFNKNRNHVWDLTFPFNKRETLDYFQLWTKTPPAK